MAEFGPAPMGRRGSIWHVERETTSSWPPSGPLHSRRRARRRSLCAPCFTLTQLGDGRPNRPPAVASPIQEPVRQFASVRPGVRLAQTSGWGRRGLLFGIERRQRGRYGAAPASFHYGYRAEVAVNPDVPASIRTYCLGRISHELVP